MTPTGHRQVVETGSGRRFVALWRDAHGKRHKKVIGEAWADETLRVAILVAAYTGLRMGKLRALRWRDVDFAKRSVFVRRNFTGGQERVPKSGKVRSVPMVDQALVALDGLSRRDAHVAPDNLVFCDEWGRHLYDYTIRDGFYDALEAAGLGH